MRSEDEDARMVKTANDDDRDRAMGRAGDPVNECFPEGARELATKRTGEFTHPAASEVATRGRVLVVDDDASVGNAIRRALARNHDVTLVQSAQDALDLLRDGERFDVILSDLMMPGMTGMDLHEVLRVHDPMHAARMVFLSGGAFTPRAKEFLAGAGSVHVEKPFDIFALRRLVDARVQASRRATK